MKLGAFDIYFSIYDNLAYVVAHDSNESNDSFCCSIMITKDTDQMELLNRIGDSLIHYGKHHAVFVAKQLDIDTEVIRKWIMLKVDNIKEEAERQIQFFRSVWYFTQTQGGTQNA